MRGEIFGSQTCHCGVCGELFSPLRFTRGCLLKNVLKRSKHKTDLIKSPEGTPVFGRFENDFCALEFFRSGKLQNESSPKFSNFRPEFCSEFSPNFSRGFRASFRGKRRPEKIHQKSLAFFNAKFPGKFEEKIH